MLFMLGVHYLITLFSLSIIFVLRNMFRNIILFLLFILLSINLLNIIDFTGRYLDNLERLLYIFSGSCYSNMMIQYNI